MAKRPDFFRNKDDAFAAEDAIKSQVGDTTKRSNGVPKFLKLKKQANLFASLFDATTSAIQKRNPNTPSFLRNKKVMATVKGLVGAATEGD